MITKWILILCLAAGAAPLLHAQAYPTEEKAGELQAGAAFAIAKPSYVSNYFFGPAIYASFDFRDHIGIQFDFHYLSNSSADPLLTEHSYAIGPRYVWHRGRFDPYVKLQYGRGVFNFSSLNCSSGTQCSYQTTANLAYNMFAMGGGVDFHLKPNLNLRLADFQYEDWLSFPSSGGAGLTPMVLTTGVAYHFH